MKKWIFNKTDKNLAGELSAECGIDGFTAILLLAKGIHDPVLIDEFLSDEINICDPFSLKDVEKAAKKTRFFVKNREKIAIFGDYDCDGVTSIALVYSVLCELGADVIWRAPSRDSGYGISENDIKELAKENVRLIITVDNGIAAATAVDAANKVGIDVIVTDHHLPSPELPEAFAVIDPKRADCPSEFKEYAGVGVAFLFCCAVAECSPEELLFKYGDLVAIGTIADIVPLQFDNRSMVKEGLRLINKSKRPGIKALLEVAGLSEKQVFATNVAFGLSPRLNAAGRMLHPEKAVQLLLSKSYEEAVVLAKELDEANVLRQKTGEEILAQAVAAVEADEKLQNAPVITVFGEGWHQGVIGIVAAKLVTMYSRPAVVLSVDGDAATGSCRSFGEVSIHKILKNSKYIEKFGGHDSAAGLTVKREDIEKACDSIHSAARELYRDMPFESLDICCKLNPAALSLDNVYAGRRLEPFGHKNAVPIYALCDMRLAGVTELSGGKHLKLLLEREGAAPGTGIEVLNFFVTRAEFPYKIGDIIDVAVTLDSNMYGGAEQLSIIVKDVRGKRFNINERLERVREYQNYVYFGEKPELCGVTREDVAKVYKIILAAKMLAGNEAELCHIFMCDDYLRVRVILDILGELEFITVCDKSGVVKVEVVKGAERRELSESRIFNEFCL